MTALFKVSVLTNFRKSHDRHPRSAHGWFAEVLLPQRRLLLISDMFRKLACYSRRLQPNRTTNPCTHPRQAAHSTATRCNRLNIRHHEVIDVVLLTHTKLLTLARQNISINMEGGLLPRQSASRTPQRRPHVAAATAVRRYTTRQRSELAS